MSSVQRRHRKLWSMHACDFHSKDRRTMCRLSTYYSMSLRNVSPVRTFSSKPLHVIFGLATCSRMASFLPAGLGTTACRYWFLSLVLVTRQQVNGRFAVTSRRTHGKLTASKRGTHSLHSERSHFSIGRHVGCHTTFCLPALCTLSVHAARSRMHRLPRQ